MAWELANNGQPFLWLIRPGLVHCEVGSLKEVLAHSRVGRFWSYCEWNSVLESFSKGVPMICSPCFKDQKVNVRYVGSVWKVGLELLGDGLERGEIERVVRRLMEGKEGEEMRQRATDLKKKVEVCVSEGGSSYNSLNDLVEFIWSLCLPK
ncbi:hypothetical protein ACSBR1_033322 [Camellia fascicularis]